MKNQFVVKIRVEALLLAVVTCWFTIGCKENDSPRSVEQTSVDAAKSPTGNYVSNTLFEILKPGLTKEEVLEKFGKPITEFDLEIGVVCLTYDSLSASAPKFGELTGFQVVLKSNVISEWLPVLSASDVKMQSPPNNQTRTNQNSFSETPLAPRQTKGISFFIVSEQKTVGSKYIDTTRFPKLGFVRESPDLVFSGINSVEDRKDQPPKGSIQLVVELVTEDSKALRTLTETNMGKQVLILIAETPVMAPFIQAPIDTPRLLLTVPNPEEAATLLKELKRMARK